MAIKKYHRNIDQPDYVSRSQIKQEAQAIKELAVKLVDLSDAKIALLPISETSLKSLQDFKKMTSNLARKRHLMFVAKRLRQEDQEAIEAHINSPKLNQIENQQQSNDVKAELVSSIYKKLLASDSSMVETEIELLLDQHSLVERQPLRQLVRNIDHAKNSKKKQACELKLNHYLSANIEVKDLKADALENKNIESEAVKNESLASADPKGETIG